MSITRRHWLGAACGAVMDPPDDAPVLRFGLVADVQYADKDAAGARIYRDSLAKLKVCAAAFQRQHLRFVIQLGDLVDGGEENLGPALAGFTEVGPRRRHVLGNHDATIPRPHLLKLLRLRRGWYDFSYGKWRFLVLDATDASVMAGAAQPAQGRLLLAAARRQGAPNAQEWNGGLSKSQWTWLERTLSNARQNGERVLVFCHQPFLAEACRPDHLLLNHAPVLEILERSACVAACFAGHDHRGGYARRAGIHHCTLQGLVENSPQASARVAELHHEGIRLVGLAGEEIRRMPVNTEAGS